MTQCEEAETAAAAHAAVPVWAAAPGLAAAFVTLASSTDEIAATRHA